MSSIKTSCKDCVFSVKENGIQTGCELNRLDKFINQQKANFDKDHYIIDRFCNTCRNEKISKEKILEEVQASCTFIVYGLNDYWITLKSILKQTVKPKAVFVVFDDQKMFNKEKYKEYQELFKNAEIQLIFKRWFEPTDFHKMVDEVVLKCRTQFYSPVKKQIPKDFLEKFNNKINIDLLPINAYFSSNSTFQSIISCSLHKLFKGNQEHLLINKLKECFEKGNIKDRSTIIFEKENDNSNYCS